MKKLTIGSLKNNPTNRSIQYSIRIEKPLVKKIKKLLEIEQNKSRYQLEVVRNQSVLDAALNQGIPLDYKCRQGTCGRCKIKVVSGQTFLQSPNLAEQKKLQNQLNNHFRLACQAKGL